MKHLKTYTLNLSLISCLALSLGGCTSAGFKSNPDAGGDSEPVDPVDPGNPSKILPTLTIETPSSNARLNYENFTTISASGTCNQKDRVVKLAVGSIPVGSAQCDGTNWKADRLDSLAFTTPGTVKLEAVLTDVDGNSASAFRDLVRAPADRVITLSAETSTIVTKNKLKIFLIIDNSSSMAEEQNRLAEGIKRLTLSLQGFDAEFFIYSTTIYGNKGVTNAKANYLYSLNGVATDSTVKPAAPIPYRLNANLVMGNPLGDFVFNSAISKADFDIKTAQLETLVRSIGINGSNNEAGLLSMLHILTASDFETRFKTSTANGDKAAFLILSDSDDKSYAEQTRTYSLFGRNKTWSNIAKYEDEAAYTSTTSTSYFLTSVDKAVFVRMYGNVYSAEVRTKTLCSGDPCESNIDYALLSQSDIAGVNIPLRGSAACTTAFINAYQIRTGKQVSSCQFTSQHSRYVDFTENMNTNFCNSNFVMNGKATSPYYPSNGVSFNGFADWIAKTQTYLMVPNSCVNLAYGTQQTPSYSESFSGGQAVLKSGINSGDLPAMIKAKLVEKFGNNGFLLSAIINKPNEGSAECRAESEGEGTLYINFIKSLGTQGFSDTICKDDYSAALSSIATFAENVIKESMEINIGGIENITGVTLNRSGQAVVLASKDFSTSVNGGKTYLNITKGILKTGDSIYLTVQSK